MLKDSTDTKIRARVREVLKQLALNSASGIDRVSEGADIQKLGGFAEAAFVVGLKPGFRTGSALTGAATRVGKAGGNHGYLPEYRQIDASCFMVGANIPAGRNLALIDMRDVAPTLAALMGVKMPLAEGRNVFTQ